MVVRLGERPGHGSDLSGAGYRRILQGQALTLHTISDAAVAIRAWARVIYDDGTGQLLTVPESPRSASRVAEALASADVISQNGWVVNAEVEMVTADIKRGQTYVRLGVEPFGAALLADYCFSEFGYVSLGTFVPPGSGDGHLRVVTAKANGAPDATTQFILGIANTRRKVHSFAWYYASSADVASRVLDVRWEDPLGAIPTGLGTDRARVWQASTLTLTANEDGATFADHKRSGINDEGVITIDDAATDPSPFPIEVSENDTGDLFFIVAAAEVLDFDTIYLLVEDWVLP